MGEMFIEHLLDAGNMAVAGMQLPALRCVLVGRTPIQKYTGKYTNRRFGGSHDKCDSGRKERVPPFSSQMAKPARVRPGDSGLAALRPQRVLGFHPPPL